MSEKNDYIIEMHGIQKSFGGVKALRNIDLQVKRGSCHALLGENGAGKSTLMKVLTGIIAKDSGKILLNGEEVQIQSLRHAEELGIAIVPQELSFISYFTVAENIFYGEEPTRPLPLLIDWRKLYTACDEKLKELKIDLPSKMQAGKLNVSDQQMMVIARVLAKNANIIIMDEPTARLGHGEVAKLLKYIQYLKSCGKTIIYISHRLEEIFEICDTITVLRDGETIQTAPTSEMDSDKLINLMVNRQIKVNTTRTRKSSIGETVLSVKGLFWGCLAWWAPAGRKQFAPCWASIDMTRRKSRWTASPSYSKTSGRPWPPASRLCRRSGGSRGSFPTHRFIRMCLSAI